MRLGAIDQGTAEPPTQPGSDWYLLATAVGNSQLLSYANVNAAETAHSVLDAEGEDLDRIRDADGLPVIEPSGSSGKIVVTITGPTTIANGTAFTLPNGLSGRTVGTYVNPSDGAEIDAESVDTGSATNLAGGAVVRFSSPPANVATDATVSSASPLRGGTDTETDARKRERALNNRRNRPAGGNWGQLRQWALEANGAVQDAYVYPALGGPSSCKVVPVRAFDFELGTYTRSLSTAELQAVRSYIQSKMPEPQEIVIQASADLALDVTLKVTLPESALSGGNGQGWLDPTPWPPLATGNSVAISAVTATNDGLTVDAATTTAPLAGLTRVAWWSAVDRRFYTRLVVAIGGSASAWELTLESPLLDSNGDGPQIGELVSPAAFRLEAYGEQWMNLLGAFGPGENTSAAERLPRAKRRPFTTDEDPISITNTTIAQWSNGLRDPNTGSEILPSFPEVTAFSLNYASLTTPTVPDLVATAPNVFVPRHFAIYQL
ncbi:MAG TPA: baseplate J/gp47 family protein [Jiangellaceae bacterium]|nr:baseplate J/gp47 family protein [Jiangellaceae bacterium]